MISKILITGGAGNLGRFIIKEFENDYQLRVVDAVSKPNSVDHEYIQADISDYSAVNSACKGMDAVVHLAAIPIDTGEALKIWRVNTTGTFNVYEAASQNNIKKLIFSKDLYGFLSVLDSIITAQTPTDGIIRESAKVLSMSLYRESYEDGVPQSMMGFCAASQMKKYLPIEDQIQPLTQMLWLAAVEEKKTPYNLKKITVKTGGNVLTRSGRS